jgi:polysaccharide deacetylase 2 family uncharacterized protein YibQ
MGGGIILGVFWGILASLAVAAVVSLNTPLPPRPGVPGASAPVAEAPTPEAPEAVEAEADAPGQPEAEAPATRPAGPADAIPLPAGSEFNRPPPEEEAVVPGLDTAPGVLAPGAPPLPLQTTGSGIDTAPAPQPDIAATPLAPRTLSPDAADAPAPVGETSTQSRPGPVPPPVPAPESDAAPAPDATTAPRPEETVDAAPAPEPVAVPEVVAAPEEAAPAPDAPTAPRPEETVDADPAPEPVAVPEVVAAPEEAAPAVEAADAAHADAPGDAATAGAEGRAVAEAEVVATGEATDPVAAAPVQMAEAPASPPAVVQLIPPRDGGAPTMDAGVRPVAPEAAAPAAPAVPRILRPAAPDAAAGARTLPQIVAPGRVEPQPAPEAEETVAAEAGPEQAEEETPAIVAHAAPFDATETRPLIAVVLIDEPDARLDISALTDFTFPVAFAVDPMRPDAAERAAAYREAGFEVLMLGSAIPEGATATDTEVALAAARLAVPEAVALLDTTDSRIQSDRAVLEAAVGAIAREGQGLVAFPRGMNTAEQMAARVDVPAATVFRLLDDEDQRATLITRFLARAEFAAVQEGAVIVAGRTRPDTVTALYSWALGARNEGVAIAPVSAVLLRLAEE